MFLCESLCAGCVCAFPNPCVCKACRCTVSMSPASPFHSLLCDKPQVGVREETERDTGLVKPGHRGGQMERESQRPVGGAVGCSWSLVTLTLAMVTLLTLAIFTV
jgi:hypothetical protein